jgi:hypothetical protein
MHAVRTCRDTLLPPGLNGLTAVVARYSMRCIFQRLSIKYKDADAAAQFDQVGCQAHCSSLSDFISSHMCRHGVYTVTPFYSRLQCCTLNSKNTLSCLELVL